MRDSITLAQYVRKRNGVALGAKHSMRNMLYRALGAKSFPVFWHYWNPIWGFYLSRYILQPLSGLVPNWFAVVATFFVSGALHDLAISLVKWDISVLFTSWFTLMGFVVVLAKFWGVSYPQFTWIVRACINVLIVAGTFFVSKWVMGVF